MSRHNASPRRSAPTLRKQRVGRKCLVSVSVFALALAGSGLPGWQQGPVMTQAWGYTGGNTGANTGELFADLTPLANAELDHQRGGFQVGNLDISVGVSVESTIDGFVQVVTNFSIPSPGEIADVSQSINTVPDVQVPEVEIPEVEIAEVEIPEVEIPEVEIAEVEIPEVEIPEVVPPEVVPPEVVPPEVVPPEVEIPPVEIQATDVAGPGPADVTSPVAETAPQVAAEPVVLALDAAQTVFDSVEFKDKAAVVETDVEAVPDAPVTSSVGALVDSGADMPDADPTDTLDQAAGTINSTIDTAQDAIADDLPATIESAGNASGTNDHQAATPDPVTLTAANAGSSGEAASPSKNPSADADVVVSGPSAASDPETTPANSGEDVAKVVTAALGDKAQIIHRSENGHLSLVSNSLNGVSIRQSVSLNLTVENFASIQEATRVQRHLAAIARHIGVFSLRR